MNTLSETVAAYFTHFRAAIAAHRSTHQPHFAFLGMVWHYLLGLSFRLDRLIIRWKNGTLPKPSAPRPGRVRAAARTPPRFKLPGGRNWLVHRMPASGIGVFGGQLRHLLANHAELRDLLAASPQARRMLGPLCRAFAIDMDNPLVVPAAKPPPRARPDAQSAAIPPPASPPPVESRLHSTIPVPHPFLAFLRR